MSLLEESTECHSFVIRQVRRHLVGECVGYTNLWLRHSTAQQSAGELDLSNVASGRLRVYFRRLRLLVYFPQPIFIMEIH